MSRSPDEGVLSSEQSVPCVSAPEPFFLIKPSPAFKVCVYRDTAGGGPPPTCCPHPQPPPSQGAARQPHGPLVWEERLLGSGWALCVCVCVCVCARLRSRVPSCPAPPADSSPLVCSGGVAVTSVPRAPCGLGPLSRVVPAGGLRSEEHQPRPLRPALTPGSSSPTGPLGAALTV